MPFTSNEAFRLGPRVLDLGEKIAAATKPDSDGGKVITRKELRGLVSDTISLLGALFLAILD